MQLRIAARERSKAWFPPRREETSLHACKAILLTCRRRLSLQPSLNLRGFL
jgi:hypothetical protein